MVSDTKKVWAEGLPKDVCIRELTVSDISVVLSGKVMARRWRNLNPNATEYSQVTIEENTWRKRVFELLSEAHTIGGIVDLDFEVIDSEYSVRQSFLDQFRF